MDKTLVRIIRMLLEEFEKREQPDERIASLEQWREEVEEVWPQIVGGE